MALMILLPVVLLIWFVSAFLIYRGLRGVPMLSAAKCARCGYDVRWINPEVNATCPECGADLKALHAVRFGGYQRRPRLVIIGAVVALLPFALMLLLPLFFVRGSTLPRANMPTATLISGLATAADQPWNWQELDRRLSAGKLSQQEVTAAIDNLIKFLGTKPGGYRQPLAWADQFLTQAESKRMFSDEQFGRMAKAYYGPVPTVKMRPRLHRGQPFQFEIEHGNSWNLSKQKLIKALQSVRLEGGQELPAEPQFAQSGLSPMDNLSEPQHQSIRGKTTLDAAVGKHTLVFTVDMGVIPETTELKTGTDKPGQVKRWPKTRCQWTEKVVVPIEVIPPDQDIVALVTDPALAPTREQLRLTAIAYSQTPGRVVLKSKARCEGLQIPVVSRVNAQIGEKTEQLGLVRLGGSITGNDFSGFIVQPRPEIKTIKLTLTPSPKDAESTLEFDRIWGQEIVFENVPLERMDLESEASPETQPGAGAASKPS